MRPGSLKDSFLGELVDRINNCHDRIRDIEDSLERLELIRHHIDEQTYATIIEGYGQARDKIDKERASYARNIVDLHNTPSSQLLSLVG